MVATVKTRSAAPPLPKSLSEIVIVSPIINPSPPFVIVTVAAPDPSTTTLKVASLPIADTA